MRSLKVLLFGFLLLFVCRNIYAQYIPTPEDLLVSDIEGEFEPYIKTGGIYDFYNDLRTWIPYRNSEPLKNPPITYVEITFHVFLDDNNERNIV